MIELATLLFCSVSAFGEAIGIDAYIITMGDALMTRLNFARRKTATIVRLVRKKSQRPTSVQSHYPLPAPETHDHRRLYTQGVPVHLVGNG